MLAVRIFESRPVHIFISSAKKKLKNNYQKHAAFIMSPWVNAILNNNSIIINNPIRKLTIYILLKRMVLPEHPFVIEIIIEK